MTVNELNSKVHLPSVVSYFGSGKGYSFLKMPKFGWIGFNADYSHVFNIVGLLGAELGITGIYRLVTREKPDLQEYKFSYSEYIENKLVSSNRQILYWNKLMREAIGAASTERVKVGRQTDFFTRIATELGMQFLLYLNVGLITPKIVRSDVGRLLRLKDEHVNKIIVPTYYTPSHLASLELRSFEDIDKSEDLFVNAEKGWYGELDVALVGKFSDLLTRRGCTWDYKVDSWMTRPVELTDTLSTKQCIEIWSTSKNVQCDPSPLEVIKSRGELEKIKEHLKGLTRSQVEDLEKFTDTKLVASWVAARSVEADIGGTKFSCRNDRYYIHRALEEIEYTNFAIGLTKIVKDNDGEFYQHGVIYYNRTETPFIVKRKVFESQSRLMKELFKIFLEAGIGVPTLAPHYKEYIVNVIYAFNPDVRIEVTPTPACNTTVQPVDECHSGSDQPEVLHSQTQGPASFQTAGCQPESLLEMSPADQSSFGTASIDPSSNSCQNPSLVA
jgi:hypothetical protein